MAKVKDTQQLKGFFRIQITEEGKGVVGDSGWKENQVTNDGIKDFLVEWITGGTGKAVTHAALGTGTQPGAADNTLEGEVDGRAAVSASIVASKTAQFTAQFASSDSFVTTTQNIQNIGLFDSSSGGALFAGNTYASSQCFTNQDVNITYQIRFA